MKKISELSITKKPLIVFTDIDDTLTEHGLLLPEAFEAIWELSRANIKVVPVTGRPAGWCELIARQWPVAGVVGENGGFYFRYNNKKMIRHFLVNEGARKENQKKLSKIESEVLKEVPGSAVASDQFCRLLDLAIDFCEDVPPLPTGSVDKIVGIFQKHGATAKVSSIHVNGWFGDYDKLSMCKLFCEKELNFSLTEFQDQIFFVGDSPNDEPMFQFFKNSIGVANVIQFSNKLEHPPKFVTAKSGGKGFAEFSKILLSQ